MEEQTTYGGKSYNDLTLNDRKATFLYECKQARAEFASQIRLYEVAYNLELRKKADTILIMYDQLMQMVSEAQQQPPPEM